MPKDVEQRLPLARALFYIALSVVAIWGTLFFAWWYHDYTLVRRQNSPQYTLKTLSSCSKTQDALSMEQIAGLIGLPEEEPVNLYRIDLSEAKRGLESYPAMKSAKVMRLRPNGLFVEYELRVPYFILLDFENMAVDKEGYPFYLFPIYTPKKIPELYVGLQTIAWNLPIESKEYRCAVDIVTYVEKTYPKDMRLVRIDTHTMHAPSRGAQEIIVVFEKSNRRYFVRLDVREYKTGLKRFLPLAQGTSGERVVDLRYKGFALIKDVV